MGLQCTFVCLLTDHGKSSSIRVILYLSSSLSHSLSEGTVKATWWINCVPMYHLRFTGIYSTFAQLVQSLRLSDTDVLAMEPYRGSGFHTQAAKTNGGCAQEGAKQSRLLPHLRSARFGRHRRTNEEHTYNILYETLWQNVNLWCVWVLRKMPRNPTLVCFVGRRVVFRRKTFKARGFLLELVCLLNNTEKVQCSQFIVSHTDFIIIHWKCIVHCPVHHRPLNGLCSCRNWMEQQTYAMNLVWILLADWL